ncbi:MAG: aromatic ring-hydroxylating dioxygenase subunit alpha [Pseudomonadota bacterium]
MTLVDELARAEAHALPASVYGDVELADLERERIFRRAWLPVGRVDELPKPGDYITYRLLDTPLAVVRQTDGGLKAFANICRHRASGLLSGDGHCAKIVCPYHAWSYELDGRLARAPFMGQDFRRDGVRLAELPIDVWQGWIFVALKPDQAPPSTTLTDLEQRIAPRDMTDRVLLFRTDEIWACNWKTVVENFSEPYHIFSAHRSTLPGARPDRDVRLEPGGDGFAIHWSSSGFERTEHGADAIVEHPLISVFPAHLFFLVPDRGLWLAPQPDGPMRTRIRWGATADARSLPSDPDARRQHIATIRTAYEEVSAEDQAICESIARNTAVSGAGGGRLAPTEAALVEFWRWLAARLAKASS